MFLPSRFLSFASSSLRSPVRRLELAHPTRSGHDPVAVVTGAARGIGRGIALVLGEAGATVYLTDRETRANKRSELPGTVEDTAEQVGAG